jgi:hypothetical protein
MNHAKTSFSTGICAGAIFSVVQYLAPLRYGYLLLYQDILIHYLYHEIVIYCVKIMQAIANRPRGELPTL